MVRPGRSDLAGHLRGLSSPVLSVRAGLDVLRRLGQLHHPDVPQRPLCICPQHHPHHPALAQHPTPAVRATDRLVWTGDLPSRGLLPGLRLPVLLRDLGTHPPVRGFCRSILHQHSLRCGVLPATGGRHCGLRGGRPCGRGIYLPSAAAGSSTCSSTASAC